jgi:hypothetical protein
MPDLPDSVKYIIQALRTPAAGGSYTPQTGPNAGNPQPKKGTNPNLGPIEQRQDGYRQYVNEFRGGSQEGEPLSYNDWIAKEQ